MADYVALSMVPMRDRANGIACAATMSSAGGLRLWYDNRFPGRPIRYNPNTAYTLVGYLLAEADAGRLLITWDEGLAGLDLLQNLCVDPVVRLRCRNLAWYKHVDVMLQAFVEGGQTAPLERIAAGLGLSGGLAALPGRWATARKQALEGACLLAFVYQRICADRELRWAGADGGLNWWYPTFQGGGGGRLLTVDECVSLARREARPALAGLVSRFIGWRLAAAA